MTFPAPTTPAEGTPMATEKRADGLVIEDLNVGDGAVCPKGATVTIHYRGTLMNGTEFDSSYSRGKPATFPLGSLIKGWQEGIPGMKVGGKRKLTIPWPMAYGAAGHPPTIPAKADLVFEIELFGVK
jgi:FKBP-type peptidyl-prolyl cis-trans isomerase